MFKKILEIIKKYDSIIIIRHARPDMDALGSQLGLKSLLLDNFKDKKVYVDGDMSRECFLGKMDEVNDDIYKKSLIIVTDVAVENMLFNDKYKLGKEVVVFDHHNNECNLVNAIAYQDIKAAAASQIIIEFALENNLYISENTAKCLFSGIISDTNRFNYSLSSKLFNTVSKLFETNFNYKQIYDTMYAEKVDYIKMRAYFTTKFEVNEFGLGYLINKKDVFDRFKVDTFTISRGMVNVMANLENVEIWANFTEDPQTNKVICEFRSKSIPIVDIAKKYGGGGHDLACGATVENFDIVKNIMEDFNLLLKK